MRVSDNAIRQLKVGDIVYVYGRKIVIMDIECSESAEGMSVMIKACDPDSARNYQVSRHKNQSMQESMMRIFELLMHQGPQRDE